MSLEELRKEIDAVDQELSALYVKRMNICRKIGQKKTEQKR